MAFKRPGWLPEFWVDVNLGFLQVTTALLREASDSATFEVTRINVRLFKWHFDFKLYYRTWF